MTNTMTHVEELRKVASLDQCAWDYAQKLMRSSAEEIERLDADAAGVQAELESVKLERHQLRNELTAARLENQRLQEVLTIPNITPDTTSSALFIRTLSEHEKGQPVNGQDLINALMWRVKNQRKEIARLQEKRGSSEPGATPEVKCPCGVAYLRVEGGYVPACACAAKNSVTVEPVASLRVKFRWVLSESQPFDYGVERDITLPGSLSMILPDESVVKVSFESALKSVSAHLPNQAQWCQDPDCPQCASQRT